MVNRIKGPLYEGSALEVSNVEPSRPVDNKIYDPVYTVGIGPFSIRSDYFSVIVCGCSFCAVVGLAIVVFMGV